MKSAIVHLHRQTKEPPFARRIDILPALFLVAALFFLPAGSDSAALNSLAIVFISIVLEAIPFMLVGALIGGFIEAFVSRERLTAMLPKKGWRTVCVAAAAGILFPVCECAVVPVVRRLIGKGFHSRRPSAIFSPVPSSIPSWPPQPPWLMPSTGAWWPCA
jgi:uncharacterized protein